MWEKIGAVIAAVLVLGILYFGIKSNPQMLSLENMKKSFGTMGILGLILIAFIAFLVFLLRRS